MTGGIVGCGMPREGFSTVCITCLGMDCSYRVKSFSGCWLMGHNATHPYPSSLLFTLC